MRRGAPYPRKHSSAALYGAPAGSCARLVDVARCALGIGAGGAASGRSGKQLRRSCRRGGHTCPTRGPRGVEALPMRQTGGIWATGENRDQTGNRDRPKPDRDRDKRSSGAKTPQEVGGL
jgi:hypothetical protein